MIFCIPVLNKYEYAILSLLRLTGINHGTDGFYALDNGNNDFFSLIVNMGEN